jgi:iron complex transport system substrate-binding protein
MNITRAALVGLSIFTAQPLFAEDVTIQTAQGEATVSASPETVVALDVAAIDSLTALGVTLSGVPDKLYVSYLDGIQATKTGTLFEPNQEVLANLAPDLIIVGSRSATQRAPLAKIAPTIDMTIGVDTISDAKARIETYGTLFEQTEKAAAMTADLDKKLAAAKTAIAGEGNALIVMTNGPKLSAYGKNSRFGWLHSALEIPEAVEKLVPEVHGDSVSFEFIAEANPDWLIVVDRGTAVGEAASAKATLDNPLVAGTNAAKNDHIVYLSAAPLYIANGGYTSLGTTLDELTAAFSK